MKTLIKLFFGGLAILFQAKAQVPNGGFEKWESINLGIMTLDYATGWENNNLYFQMRDKQAPVTKSTDSHSGQYAISFKNVSDTGTYKLGGYVSSIDGDPMSDEVKYMFPINLKPTMLIGYYKYASSLTDMFTVKVNLYKDGNIIGEGEYLGNTPTTSWQLFKAELKYSQDITPDSAFISIYIGDNGTIVEGAELLLDDLSLEDDATTGIDQQQILRSSLTVFPNPVSSSAVIEFEQLSNARTTIDVMDILGNKVDGIVNNQLLTAGKQRISWNPSQLRPGIYFVRVTQAETSATIRINCY